MVSLEALGLIAAIAVGAVLLLARYLEKRIDHGEARFDSKTGKQIDDE